MKKPKRIRFVASQRALKQSQEMAAGFVQMASQFKLVVTCVGNALSSLNRAARAAQELAHALIADPEFQQEAKMQQLYYESWKRNELTDTLAAAGIALN